MKPSLPKPESRAPRMFRAFSAMTLLVLTLGSVSTPARAQGVLDPSFAPPTDWLGYEQVTALGEQPDGKIVIGGYFYDNGKEAAHLMRLNADGSRDATFPPVFADGTPELLLVQPDGKILIGAKQAGGITQVNGQSVGALVRLNADGSLDPNFVAAHVDNSLTPYLSGIALQSDGKIIIAGRFSTVAGATQRCIARLNPDGSFDSSLASVFPSDLYCPEIVALRSDGKIYAGGSFPYPTEDDTRSTLFRLNPDGSLDADLSAAVGFTPGFASAVNALFMQPDGRLLVSGNDDGGHLIRLNADDSRDTGFDVKATAGAGNGTIAINSVFAQPNGKIVISGAFTDVNQQARTGIARFNADGTLDNAFILSAQGSDNYLTLSQAQADGKILVIGAFTRIEGMPRHNIARLLVPDSASQNLSFVDATHSTVRWQRTGAGIELTQVRFESSTDGNAWTPLGLAAWNAGTWQLGGLVLPAQTSLWLRATGTATTGTSRTGMGIGLGGSVLGSTRQLVVTVTPSATAGGSISPAVPQYIDTGSTASFTITPDPGQQILAVEGNCGGTLSGTTFTTVAITANCTVQARFVAATAFVVTPSAGPGGSIVPVNAQGVEQGETLALAVTPDAGYAIAGVGGSCGGTLNGQIYTTLPIMANCTVEASFSTTTVTVNASTSGGHGTIGPQTQTLDYGAVATLTVLPEPGYNAFVSGCGGTLSGTNYTTAALAANCTVTASFAPFSSAGTSLQLKMAPSGQDPCAGTSTVEIAAGEQVSICLTLSNQTGRMLRSMTITRSAMPGDFNAYLPGLLATGGIQSGLTYNSYLSDVFPRESTDLNIVWSALDESPIPGYVYDDAALFEALDISSSPTATSLGLTRPRTNATVHMPFTFHYFGIPTRTLCVSADGAIIVALEACDTWGIPLAGFGDSWLQLAPALRTSIDYESGYAGGAVYTDVIGTAPNRRFVVQWHDKHIVGYEGGSVTFQALIDEATSAITFQYVTMTVGDSSVDDGRGSMSALVLGNGAAPAALYPGALTSGKAIRWVPGAQPFTALATTSGHITVRAPEIEVEPSAIEASVVGASATTVTLTLANLGNARLDWDAAAAAGDGRGFEIERAYATPMIAAAPASPKSAPRTTPKMTSETAARPHGTDAVPAFAHAWENQYNSRPVSLDAATPVSLTRTAGGSVNIWPVHAGGFVDNDFSQLYLMQSPGGSDDAAWSGSLQKFDPQIPNSDRLVLAGVGTVAVDGLSWRGLRWDLRTNTLFGVATNWVDEFSLPPFHTSLYHIDPATGWTTFIARLDDVSSGGTVLADIAIDNNGNLYGIDMVTDTLIAIDKVSGHIRQIGPTGLNVGYYGVQSTDFDHSTGTLYYATWTTDSTVGAQMFTVDTTTGVATLVGTIGDGHSGLRALSIAKPGGSCVNVDQVPWLSLDHSQGTVDAASADTLALRFDAQGLSAGTYRANLCIGNNTPYRGQVTVPMAFTVTTGDGIFANGFEAN